MRFNVTFLTSLLLTSTAASVIDPAVLLSDGHVARVDTRADDSQADGVPGDDNELWKRRGGGGGGGRGGGGGGRGGGSSSSSGSKSGGGSRGGSSNGQGYNTKSNSNVGGYSRLGSGPQPSFGGGKFYGGGGKVPYAAGNRGPGGINPVFFAGGAALAFWPGLWLGGAYAYPYVNNHRYHNDTSDKDEDHPVICGCAEKEVCSCEEIEDNDYWEDILEDGDYSKLNKSVVTITEVNGTTTILLNGTLPKGTTLKSDDEDDWAEYVENAAGVLRVAGLWPAVAAVGAAVLMA